MKYILQEKTQDCGRLENKFIYYSECVFGWEMYLKEHFSMLETGTASVSIRILHRNIYIYIFKECTSSHRNSPTHAYFVSVNCKN